ncbi:LOW QUALITY PROTEIN: uncharacterized protein ACR2FA_006652 [Aphomia sociella]
MPLEVLFVRMITILRIVDRHWQLLQAKDIDDANIERRVKVGNAVNGAVHYFLCSQNVFKKARLAVHNSVLIPTLMYGSESWVWQKRHESRINAVEIHSLRSMSGIKLSDRVRNNVIRDVSGLKEGLVTRIEKGMLRWFGHVERMNDKRLCKRIYTAEVTGRVCRERPRRAYVDQVSDILKNWQVRSTRNCRACMKRCMTVAEARDVDLKGGMELMPG